MKKAFKVVVFICAAEKFKHLNKLHENSKSKPPRLQELFNDAKKVWEEIEEYQQIGKENNYFYLNMKRALTGKLTISINSEDLSLERTISQILKKEGGIKGKVEAYLT